jgi:hypothetical protein
MHRLLVNPSIPSYAGSIGFFGCPGQSSIETLRQSLRTSCAIELSLEDMLAMYFQGLISYWEADGKPVYSRDARDQDWVGLTFKGMAVLINSSDKYLDRVVSGYNMPDGVTASLVPLLDLSKVPAADRYVSTADNQEIFAELAKELETVKAELVKDQNANELPIPVQTKRAMAAELEGLIGQVRAGYIRISDLTLRARPLVKSIADTCKDVGIIAGAAYAAYELIGKILGAIF